MKRTGLTTRYWLANLALTTIIWAAPALAQPQSMAPQDQDNDSLKRWQVRGFDEFLDKHPELDEQLRKNPSLVNDEKFVENHPDLQRYLQEHPGVREQLQEDPNAVMHREERFDRREDRDRDRDRDRDNDITHRELANMDRFLDSHPEIAEQLRKDPSLLDNQQFVKDHPSLQEFLAQHPGVREEIRENPNAFMSAERRFDRREDSGDRDVTRYELANMDRFLDNHPEIAEQLRKDPSLVNNKKFVEDHPALQQFLAEHQSVRDAYQENPNGFMRQEDRFDRHEDSGFDRDRDVTRRQLSSFHEFLQNHETINGELSKNPSLAKNEEYLENHSALSTYLNANPQVREELNENPQSFVKAAQTFDTAKAPTAPEAMPKSTVPKVTTKPPVPDPQSK